MKELFKYIKHLVSSKFFGQLIIKFENGSIVHCQKTESIKFTAEN